MNSAIGHLGERFHIPVSMNWLENICYHLDDANETKTNLIWKDICMAVTLFYHDMIYKRVWQWVLSDYLLNEYKT